MSGFVGLKLRLYRAQRQIIDLWEQVPSWSALEYEAATITPVEFHETSEIYNLSYDPESRFSKVAESLDYFLKNDCSSVPNPIH